MMIKRIFYLLSISVIVVLFAGCATVVVPQQTFSAQTKLSSAVELNAVSTQTKTIYLIWQNNTSINNTLKSQIRSSITQKGYQFVADQSKAQFLLQISLLQIGLADPDQLQTLLNSDYGDALLTLLPITIPQVTSADTSADTINISGLIPVMLLDMQVSEKVGAGQTTGWNRYQTRVITRSPQPNIMFDQVKSAMNQSVVDAIVKIFN